MSVRSHSARKTDWTRVLPETDNRYVTPSLDVAQRTPVLR